MAWLEQKSSGTYLVAFRFGAQKFKKSLRTSSRKAAEGRLSRLEENLGLVDSGRLVIPDDADIASFLLSDGQINGKHKSRSTIRTLKNLSDAFLDSIPEDSLEETTLKYFRIHIRHLKKHLGANALIREIQLAGLQDYVDARSQEKGIRGKNLSPTTIKKEMAIVTVPDHAALAKEKSPHWVVPSENEWYRAAYYDPNKAGGGYWKYPAKSDSPPQANINTNWATEAGEQGVASAYGTFDQGGNVWEYNDTRNGGKVGLRGGSFYLNDSDSHMQSNIRYDVYSAKWPNYGFRVVRLGGAKAAE